MRACRRTPPRRAAPQQGVVAIMFALSLVVLMGFVGLALDGGRLYVNKSELQNAADACALAAAQELHPTNALVLPDDFNRARDAGTLVATRNRSDFQSRAVQALLPGEVTVTFADAPDAPSSSWSEADAAQADDRVARCTVASPPLALWLMPVLNISSASVSAVATATRLTPPDNCAIPTGLCGQIASLLQ